MSSESIDPGKGNLMHADPCQSDSYALASSTDTPFPTMPPCGQPSFVGIPLGKDATTLSTPMDVSSISITPGEACQEETAKGKRICDLVELACCPLARDEWSSCEDLPEILEPEACRCGLLPGSLGRLPRSDYPKQGAQESETLKRPQVSTCPHALMGSDPREQLSTI